MTAIFNCLASADAIKMPRFDIDALRNIVGMQIFCTSSLKREPSVRSNKMDSPAKSSHQTDKLRTLLRSLCDVIDDLSGCRFNG